MRIRSGLFLFIMPLMVVFFEGCYYFKIAATTNDGRQVDGAINRDKYIIVHNQDGEVWHLTYPEFNRQKAQLTGRFAYVGDKHQFYKLAQKMRSNRYTKEMGDPSNEVHLYIGEYAIDSLNQVIIPFDAIERMDVYDTEKGKIFVLKVLKFTGIFIGTYILIGLLFSFIL